MTLAIKDQLRSDLSHALRGVNDGDDLILLDGWYDIREIVKAVLRSVHEPTKTMMDSTNYPNTNWDSGVEDVWRVMIDAALKDITT